MKIIVTAGGQGTKMWPYSRQSKPKQFQPIIGSKTLYEQTIDALLTDFDPEDIFVSTKRKFIGFASEQSPQIPLKNFIVEPDIPKDRGPGEGFAFLWLELQYPDEPFIIVQADILHQPVDKFIQMIREAEALTIKTKKMVTGGTKATEPILGIDYLQLGDKIEDEREAYVIDKFVYRKKTLRETRDLIDNFHIVTHSNHTCWYPGLMLEAYKQYRPDWYQALMKIKEVIGKSGEVAAIEEIYSSMEAGPTEEVTINVMNAGESAVILLPYKWTDVGTWNSVYDLMVEDDNGNYEDGNIIAVDSERSLFKGLGDKLIAVAGVKDLVVVDTEDALLIVAKDEIDKLKDIQTICAETTQDKYL